MKIKDLKSPYREIIELERTKKDSDTVSEALTWYKSRAGDEFYYELNQGNYPPITPEIKSLYPELKDVFDRCDLPDLGTSEKPFDEVLDETVETEKKPIKWILPSSFNQNELSEEVKNKLTKPNWKWHLTSITNNSGTTQTQFKMSDFGEPYEIEKINDTRYKFKLPTNDGWVLGFGVKIFVE